MMVMMMMLPPYAVKSSKDPAESNTDQSGVLLTNCRLTFEEGFLQDEVVDVESASESGVVVRKADIARLLQREELFHLLLDAGRNVLVHVDQPQHVRAAKGEGKVLDRPRDGEARVGVLILGLQVVHAGVGEAGLDLFAGQPHMLRLCCAAQLAGVAACLSTHSPGRGRRSGTWA